jgi:hypothetical protein
MARIPFESPEEKITVEGASLVLQDLRWSSAEGVTPAGLHFVSSSPPQLREKLEGKMVLDRVDWTSDSFKNQGYNLKMARLDLLRHHIAYKSLAIMKILLQLAPGSKLIMIGDSAESDSYIYTGLKFFTEGLLSKADFCQWLSAALVEKKVIEQMFEAFERMPDNLEIESIFIRKLPRELVAPAPVVNNCIYYFEHFFQVAWALMDSHRIAPSLLWNHIRVMHNECGFSRAQLAGLLQHGADFGCDSPDLQRVALESVERLGGVIAGAEIPKWRLKKYNSVEKFPVTGPEILKAGVAWCSDLIKHRSDKKR